MKLREELFGDMNHDDGDIGKALLIAVPLGLIFWGAVIWWVLR